MKALKSPLAKKLLADPRTRQQLQSAAVKTAADRSPVVIQFAEGESPPKRYIARIVAKSA
jgi:hypothetical protein